MSDDSSEKKVKPKKRKVGRPRLDRRTRPRPKKKMGRPQKIFGKQEMKLPMEHPFLISKQRKGITTKILDLSEEVRMLLYHHRITPRLDTVTKRKEKKYHKDNFIRVYEGYDAFQYWFATCAYIKKKYGLDDRRIGFILYLAPKQLMSRKEFREYHAKFYHGKKGVSFMWYIRNDWFHDITGGSERETENSKNVYAMTSKCKRMVAEFYEIMSGEKDVKIDMAGNPKPKTEHEKLLERTLSMLKEVPDRHF